MCQNSSPTLLTAVHYFDFHRDQRSLFYNVGEQVSIGPYTQCQVTLPTPSLFKGVVTLNDRHELTQFKNFHMFQTADQAMPCFLFRGLKNETWTQEQDGIMLTIRRSWQPFELLIDTLVEEISFAPTDSLEKQISTLLPEEILALWPLDQITHAITQHQSGFGDIDALMKNSEVTEILVNGCESVYYEKNGEMIRHEAVLSSLRLERLITKLVQNTGRSVNTKRPMVDFQLPSGERVNIILPPLSKQGALISIRKFKRTLNSLDALSEKGTFNEEAKIKLKECVLSKKNILVSGGTGTGKTTLLNALLSATSKTERLLIVEDSSELAPDHPHTLSLEARPPNEDPQNEITLAALIKNTLRMRPTRVICGECRGPEAFQMLLAMNSGHPGSMTTIHANSPLEALYRLEIFLLMAGFDVPHRALRQFIASAIDVVVQMTHNGQRQISEMSVISLVDGQYTLVPL